MRRMTVVVLAAVFVVASCGGGGDKKSSSTEATTTTSKSASTGGAAAGAFTSAKCRDAATAMAKAASAIPQAITGGDKDLKSATDELEAFANAAPKAIRADMKTVAAGYAAFVKIFVDSGYDPSSGKPPSQEVIQKLQQESAKINTSEFQAAATRVNTWVQQECGR